MKKRVAFDTVFAFYLSQDLFTHHHTFNTNTIVSNNNTIQQLVSKLVKISAWFKEGHKTNNEGGQMLTNMTLFIPYAIGGDKGTKFSF